MTVAVVEVVVATTVEGATTAAMMEVATTVEGMAMMVVEAVATMIGGETTRGFGAGRTGNRHRERSL